jgi:hypothetical protein
MSNMKDYMMWLDNEGIAEWDNAIGEPLNPLQINLFSNDLIVRYMDDAKWHGVELGDDDDDNMASSDDEDDNGMLSDDDLGDNHELLVECSWTPEEQWLNPDGGMTADALTYLHELDSKGELI